MNKQGKTVAVLLVLAITASGCIEGGGGSDETTVNPIKVNTFEAIPQPAFSDRRVSVNLELENTGDLDAENAAARVFGPTFARSSDDDKAWRNQSDGNVTVADRATYFGTLSAPSDNSPSIPKQQTWRFTAPNLSQNREVDYNFYSKIFYQYQTSGETDFTIMSAERFHETGTSQSDATIEATDGPIQLDIRGVTPKLFYLDDATGDEGKVESEICIRVTNEGEGTPFLGGYQDSGDNDQKRNYEVTKENENKVKISVQEVGNVEFESQDSSETNSDIVVEMPSGKEGFQCFDMKVNEGLVSNNPQQEINTQVEVEYGYMKEASTTATVEGRRGSGQGDDIDTSVPDS